jgi:hypothetical protein
MHILESHSLNSQLKFKCPSIYPKMFPVSSKKYVIIDTTPCEKNPSTTYPLWDEVIMLAFPILKSQNTDIIIYGNAKTNPFNLQIIPQNAINDNQLAFLIKESIAYISANSFGAAVASSFGKKIIYLEDEKQLIKTNPFLSKSCDHLSIKFKNKISQILPEEVANALFELIKIKIESPIKTLSCGNFYSDAFYLDIIPDYEISPSFKSNIPTHIRYDLVNPETNKNCNINLFKTLKTVQKASIVTNKPIDQEILFNCKEQIDTIIYDVTDGINTEFAKTLCNFEKLVFLFHLTEQNAEELANRKLSIIDLPFLVTVNKILKIPEYIEQGWSKLFFFSNKMVLSNNKFYSTYDHYKKGLAQPPVLQKNIIPLESVEDKASFWKDSGDFSFIFKRID